MILSTMYKISHSEDEDAHVAHFQKLVAFGDICSSRCRCLLSYIRSGEVGDVGVCYPNIRSGEVGFISL